MEQTFLAEMRALLTARDQEIRATLTQMEGAADPVSPDNAIGRLTRVGAMEATSVRQALARDHEIELAQVEQALAALDAGTYGSCRRCGEEIAEARLRARPQSFLCLACKSEAAG